MILDPGYGRSFKRRTARRIAALSLIFAAIASPVSWYVARQNAEQGTAALALEESRRLLVHFDVASEGPDIERKAQQATEAFTGGLFDIAEIYGPEGEKLAESATPNGREIEDLLPSHARPTNLSVFYESLQLPDSRWVMRVFVPLRPGADDESLPVIGYLEGVRVVPDWQREQILANALAVAVIASLAALLCGLAIYPVVVSLSADNERKARELLDSHISMMEALGRAIAKRDSDTGAHNYRVAWLATLIAEGMGLRGAAMQSLIVGSFLHDVGKIGVPDAILLKPQELNGEELAIMRAHVALGEEIVRGIGWLEGAADVVSAHHEWWDGSGYPRGLAGADIPLAARIFAVADVFDALCSKRPYKEPMGFDAAMDVLARHTGSHFDPGVMAVFGNLARPAYERLAGRSEAACRELLEVKLRTHFGLT